MKRKPIQIDWDELETAFENRNEDLTYYLDLVTGQVILEGEGEDVRFDDDALDNGVEVDLPTAARRPASTSSRSPRTTRSTGWTSSSRGTRGSRPS